MPTPASSSSLSVSSSSSSSSSPPPLLSLESRYLLSNLFSDDTGRSSPNPATYHAYPDASFSSLSHSQSQSPGLPYRWVQWLTAFPSLPFAPSSASPFPSIFSTYSSVFSSIRDRLTTRSSLRSQLDSLGIYFLVILLFLSLLLMLIFTVKLSIPSLYNKKSFPRASEFTLALWKEIPRATFEVIIILIK